MFSVLGRPRGIAALASTIAIISASAAHAQEAFVSFDIPAQPLAAALLEFSRQADIPVGVDPALVNGKSAPAVQGSMAPTEALNRLLVGSGLVATRRPEGGGFVLAESPTRLGDAAEAAPRETAYGEIVVTGTRIRGVADQFSPVTRLSRDDIDLAGAATVADVFDTLPQNFGGGIAPDTVIAGSNEGVGAASVNLRGLGNEATLILLNGRRLAPGGLLGSFVDISAISASAIERIEVLPDGASAIYGADAIAGVVNIITRDDFGGGETRLGVSGVEGGAEAIVIGQTLGWSGERSHGLLTYQYSDQNELGQNDKDFSRGQLPNPNWLLPASESHSLFVSAGVEMTPSASFDFDVYYNRRESEGSTSYESPALFRASQLVELEQYGAAGGLHVSLAGDWAGDVSLTYSRTNQVAFTMYDTGDRSDDSVSEIASIDISLGGTLFHITNEPVELVFGAHTRAESNDHLALVNPGGVGSELDDQRRVASGYFELYAPLVAGGDGMVGMRRLALTAAGRYDDYDDVGSSFNPRLGLIWSPAAGFHLRGAWGTAFRAPRLQQLRHDFAAGLGVYDDPAAPGGESVALLLAGGGADLSPEEAETWTIGFDFEPAWLEGMRLRVTYFNVTYEDRIDVPSYRFSPGFRFADFTGVPVRSPSNAQVQAFVDDALTYTNFGDFFPIGPLALADVEVILDARTQNLSSSSIGGVDFEAAYGVGHWSFFLNGTYLSEFSQQTSPTTSVVELRNTFANPVDLRLRGGASWSTELTTAALFINHVAGYTDDESIDPTFSVESWTTFDASLRLDLGRFFGGGDDRETSLTFTAVNLLDEDPPELGPRVFRTAIFDAANADPSGRRVGILLSKRW